MSGSCLTSDCCWRPICSLARFARPAYDVRSGIAYPLCGETLHLLAGLTHQVQKRVGMLRRDLQKHSCRSLRLPTSLLPVLQRPNADP